MSRLSSYLKGDWSWEAAETACQKKGGHLTSITTLEKKKSVKKVLDKVAENEWISYVWLGGSDTEAEGNWSWSDKSAWGFENWFRNEPSNKTKENCLKMRPYDEIWLDERCSRKYRPLCDKEMHVFKGKLNRTWTLSSKQVPQLIEVVFESQPALEPSKRTGLSLSWSLETGLGDDLNHTAKPVFVDDNRFLVGMTNLVHDLKKKGSTETEIWTDVIVYKMSLIDGGAFKGYCEKSQLMPGRQKKEIDTFSKTTTTIGSLSYKAKLSDVMSEEDMGLGLQIYSFLIYCHGAFDRGLTKFENNFDDNNDNGDLPAEFEGLELFIFYFNTIDMKSANILQTFVNMKRSTKVDHEKNKRGIERMLEELTKALQPSFSKILDHMYTKNQVDQLAKTTNMTFIRPGSPGPMIHKG